MVSRGTLPEEARAVVVGAGHAGCEAALALARLGIRVTLVTLRLDGVARMSCNPAIGGLGKSQIVREVDAMGGEMARAADAAAIHFRRLNASKGPAVRARRVQCDLDRYHRTLRRVLEATPGLELIEGEVGDLQLDRDSALSAVVLVDGRVLPARAAVLTTGTFLRGRMHIGPDTTSGGREGDPAADALGVALQRHGFLLGRLKTGTPPRLEAATVDLASLPAQSSDDPALAFSHEGTHLDLPPVVCHLVRTGPHTHELIRRALPRSPLFTGVIQGVGPRYCPSIEDKVVRFPDRQGHQVVLEPMGLDSDQLYPNGISTSLPRDVQLAVVRSLPGCERAEVAVWGYAVEYDYVLPEQLDATLETHRIPGLFLAGQIVGTSGYEEAAGLGLLAGINAAARLFGRSPVVLGREQAYLGVMVDDLVTRGTREPYRMFSSRAEHRLLLREDNATERLAEVATAVGLVPASVLEQRRNRRHLADELEERLRRERLQVEGRHLSLEQYLRRPEVTFREVAHLLGEEIETDVLERVEVRIKYRGYIERQQRQAEKLAALGSRHLPADLEYSRIPGLSRELQGKLSEIRPRSFAQASRIDGITPAALMALSMWLERTGFVPRGTTSSRRGRADD